MTITKDMTQAAAGLSFAEAKALREACEARMSELREVGVSALAARMQEMAIAEVGMNVEEVMAAIHKASGKRSRGRPRLVTNGHAE